MLSMSNPQSSRPEGSSLWTTPATNAQAPLKEAAVDTSVSAAKLRDALEATRDRIAAFSGHVTDELLRKSF